MRSLWWSRRAIGLHVALFVSVPGFFALGWWQLHRALSGNALSWVYTFEWPFFAAYATWMWWKLVHEPPAVPAPLPSEAADGLAARPPRPTGVDDSAPAASVLGEDAAVGATAAAFDPYDESEPELAAYNRYLASLHAADRVERS